MKDFTGFKFNNIHTKDLNLIVVSSGDRYEKNLLPSITDYTTDIPGNDGSYYYGQTYGTREFTCSLAFDKVDEFTWRKISQLFSTDKLSDLVFDELPYKTYKAKLKSKPEFKFICFTDRDTGNRVYKGEGTLNFVCYYPYAFGFNKYIVTAADYYKNVPPETIIKQTDYWKKIGIDDNQKHTQEESPYANNILEQRYDKNSNHKYEGNDKGTREKHFNIKGNMNSPWKGGFPTTSQVMAGELYWKDPNNQEKMIIDVRGYWDNVPEWAASSKLLTTPTLDYDQELIYLPQYSKTNYMNMETGLNDENELIGTRILVYNPGDVPIDFELKINSKYSTNGERMNYFFGSNDVDRFQIRRLNVERLTLQEAVDWTGLTTADREDNSLYKYGNKYFKRTNHNFADDNGKKIEKILITYPNENPETKPFYTFKKQNSDTYYNENTINFNKLLETIDLDGEHPNHAYIAEPIPRQRLGHFLKSWYWQSSWKFFPEITAETDNEDFRFYNYKYNELRLSWYEQGLKIAEEYDELYKKCIIEEEKYELYWNTIDKWLEHGYGLLFKNRQGDISLERLKEIFIHKPLEFITITNKDKNFGEFDFNVAHLPQFITEEYLEIKAENLDNRKDLFLDTSKHMLYEIENPLYGVEKEFCDYKPKKNILNDEIIKGKWFKLPPGWSLLEITPVISDNIGLGKLWKNSRQFNWGYGGDELKHKIAIQELYDYIYNKAANIYKEEYYKNHDNDNDKNLSIEEWLNFRHWFCEKYYNNKLLQSDGQSDTGLFHSCNFTDFVEYYNLQDKIEDYYKQNIITKDFKIMPMYKAIGNFTNIYLDEQNTQLSNKNFIVSLAEEFLNYNLIDLELGFLKTIHSIWQLFKGIEIQVKHEQEQHETNEGKCINQICKGSINEWWWYACNYIWDNFPPVYWSAAEGLNQIKAKYIPLFY